VFVPPFARLFLDAARREAETRQYAAAFFLDNTLSRTRRRNAVLLLVGAFERSVVILPDSGLPLASAELQDIIARMTPRLAAGQIAPALRDGLDALEALLVAKGFAGGGATRSRRKSSRRKAHEPRRPSALRPRRLSARSPPTCPTSPAASSTTRRSSAPRRSAS
jgi:uncharacterized membrane protein YgcG